VEKNNKKIQEKIMNGINDGIGLNQVILIITSICGVLIRGPV